MIFAVLLVAGVSATVWLGACALRSWREQRAALAYELVPSYRGTALRAVAALAAAGCALAGGTGFVVGQSRPGTVTVPAVAAVAGTAPVRSAPAHPSATPVAADAAGRRATPVPSPAGPPPGLTTVGRPADGELREGTLPGYPGRLRVWLPQQYPRRSHPLQALVVLADPAQLADVLRGLAEAVADGRANPLVVVAPEPAPGGPTPGAFPRLDGAALRDAVVRMFHVEPSVRSWGVLGLGTGAAPAVAAETTHPEAYAAGVGLGGRYDGQVPLSTGRPGLRLLLADTARDAAGQASAARLRHALADVAPGGVRLSDTVRDLDAQSERIRLARQAAGYLAEQMAVGDRR
ncbi:hypothetical protein [Streptacidiphilus sp. P02-A3a]|uniref:hypothetical protein n=1 Tax=Streptacidiphilus sp. P02-A3a TaxID=2704468 RepID=UPI0015FADDCE|nr:hypothetical protein [Streptacidiphilus sp. P02-A3a]QMU67236.1 hypothetical protein GXP74_02440 [Streptacidiphilus sp. P02-A3a]